MGAQLFECYVEANNVDEAFAAAVEDAYYWHGHAGYSGSIAEKSSYIYPIDTAFTAQEIEMIYDAFYYSWQGNDKRDVLVDVFGVEVDDVVDAFNDKWGPAIALRCNDNRFFFCGWASC